MQPPADGNRRLDSWKAIADYLGRDVGTVRRWEKAQGLPVRRVPGGRGRSVFAFTEEIDAWLRDSEARRATALTAPAFSLQSIPAVWRWSVAAASLFVIVISAAAFFVVRNRTDDGQITIQITELGVVARDITGGERWRYQFPTEYRTLPGQVGRQWLTMTGSNPAAYVITSHRLLRDHRVLGGELLAFDDRGTVRRRFMFDDEYRLRGTAFGGDDRGGGSGRPCGGVGASLPLGAERGHRAGSRLQPA
jgi:hypothetical protein